MIKIFRYLKNSVPLLLVVVALLAAQAVCDLALPAYTADIVNVGIQQGGVTDAAPQVLRAAQMEKVLLFTTAQQGQEILSRYTLLARDELGDDEYAGYADRYPLLAQEPLYLRREMDRETLDGLNILMSKPMLAVLAMEQDADTLDAATEQLRALFPPGTAPEDATLFDLLALMDAGQRAQVLEQMARSMPALPDNMLVQAAAPAVRAEYAAVGVDTDAAQTMYILWTGLKMILLTLASVSASILVTLLSARVAAALGMNLRGRIFDKVVSFSGHEFDRFSTASLITRSTNDIQQVQMMMVMFFRIIVYAPILGVGGVIKVLNTNSLMSWVIAVAVLAIMALVAVLFSVTMPRFRRLQLLIDRLNLVSREILSGLPVIRAFNNQRHEEKRFDDANRDLTRTNLFVSRAMTLMMPAMTLIMNGVTLLIIWVGAGHIDLGAMQVGDMMAFIQYAMQIIMAFLMISMISIMLPRATVSARRIHEVLDTDVSIRDPDAPVPFDPARKGVVEFEDVSFRYPGAQEDVLSHVTFSALPGRTTAIIGSTGSGKSTLVNLIPRFYDVTGGRVLVDGADIRTVTQQALRARIGFVPQAGILFSGTMESNIKFGNEQATQEQMDRAAAIAQAADFIAGKTDGYRSEISQGGGNVSGGQRQRLSIARAIAKDPEIYIFDDSFSALDYTTDAALRRALGREIAGATLLIVAQRISTVLYADQIVVLDEGRVVGIGTHRELLRGCDGYYQIASSQLTKEELDNE